MTWENDERGKPCKWLHHIIVSSDDRVDPDVYRNKLTEIDAAYTACNEAVRSLVETGEYVVIVAPETKREERLETTDTVFTVRARVRWLTPEAKANRERNLAAMFDAVDDEVKVISQEQFQRTMQERGGKPN